MPILILSNILLQALAVILTVTTERQERCTFWTETMERKYTGLDKAVKEK